MGLIGHLPTATIYRGNAPAVGFAGRLSQDGRFFANQYGTFRPTFRPIWVSALTILMRSDSEISNYLDWVVATGFNGIRVFAGALIWAGQTAEIARAQLPFVLAECLKRGLYVEVTAITDSRDGQYDISRHLNGVAVICSAYDNTVIEMANEYWHPTQSDDVHDTQFLTELALVVPKEIITAIGAGPTDEPAPEGTYDSGGAGLDYVSVHLDRGRDKWNMVRRVRELEQVSSVTKRPVLNNEPIGAAESAIPGKRENDPSIFYTMGLLNRLFEVGGVFHSDSGLAASTPPPVQQACSEAFVAGSKAIPTENRLVFANTGWATSPIASADFNRVVRAYTGVAENKAYTALVGLSGDPALRLQGGWSIDGLIDERPGVQLLGLSKG